MGAWALKPNEVMVVSSRISFSPRFGRRTVSTSCYSQPSSHIKHTACVALVASTMMPSDCEHAANKRPHYFYAVGLKLCSPLSGKRQCAHRIASSAPKLIHARMVPIDTIRLRQQHLAVKPQRRHARSSRRHHDADSRASVTWNSNGSGGRARVDRDEAVWRRHLHRVYN